MRREYVRLFVGLAVMATHLIAFFGIVVWQRKYIANERIDVAMLLVPVSAGYFVAVIRSAVQRQEEIDSKLVNLNYTAVVFLVTSAFCAALLVFVFGYPDIVGPTVVELRRWLVLLEIGFGAGFGLIAEDLFGKVERVVVPADPGAVERTSG